MHDSVVRFHLMIMLYSLMIRAITLCSSANKSGVSVVAWLTVILSQQQWK